MAIDTSDQITAGYFVQWMAVERLGIILDDLQDDDLLYPNRVGNLSVIRNSEQVGYIDFQAEKFSADSGY